MRVKGGPKTRRRHKKILKLAKGYRGARSRRFKTANEAVLKALMYSYIGRKLKKRQMRKLWIVRINAAAREHGLSYSQFMQGLKKANVELNRKMLATLAVSDKEQFKKLVELARANLPS